MGLGNDAYWFQTRADTNDPALSWLNFGPPFPQCVWLPEPLPSGTAIREAPALFLPGVPFTVTIQVVPAEHVTSLECGDLKHGSARACCPKCRAELTMPFS